MRFARTRHPVPTFSVKQKALPKPRTPANGAPLYASSYCLSGPFAGKRICSRVGSTLVFSTNGFTGHYAVGPTGAIWQEATQ